jgi:hypothetical protein
VLAFAKGLFLVLMLQSNQIRRACLAIMISFAMLCASLNAALAHLPNRLAHAELDRHAQLQMEIAEHGHSHDDGWDEERHPGHHHGHDAADHSHDVPNVPAGVVIPGRMALRDWRDGPPRNINPDPAFRLKRPPRVS